MNSTRNQIFYGVRRPDIIDGTLGGAPGLIAFVRRAHELNLTVVVDNVPNGLRHDSPYLPTSPDFCGGADVLRRNSSGDYVIAWGSNVELDWSSLALREWWTAEIGVKWVRDYGVDGFRCDCEPHYGSTPLWSRLAQAVFDATGKRILIMSETNPTWGQASSRGFAFHLSQHDYDSHDISTPTQTPRQEDWFYGSSTSSSSSSSSSSSGGGGGDGSGGGGGGGFVDAVKRCGEPLATRTLSNHDYQQYAVRGQFAAFVYGTIISPFSPHWFGGEESNQTRNLLAGGTGVLYFQQMAWGEATDPAAATLVARVAKMLRIRKECSALFGASPEGTPINSSVQLVELSTVASSAATAAAAAGTGASVAATAEDSFSVLPAYMFWRPSAAVFVLASRLNPHSSAGHGGSGRDSALLTQPMQQQQLIINVTSFPQLQQKMHALPSTAQVEVVDLERQAVVDGPKPIADLARRGFSYAVAGGDAAVLLVRPAARVANAQPLQRCGAAVPHAAN